MPLERSNLIGIWYTGGGWSSYNLIFRPDGVGRAEFANLHLTNVLTFRWRLQGGDLIVDGTEQIELNDAQDDVVRAPWDTTLTIPVSIARVQSGEGNSRSVLKFGEPLIDWFPLEYFAGNPEFNLFREPDFTWLQRADRSN